MAHRFLIYAINGNGFGHVVRTLAVATRLKKRMPDANFLFLTSCEDPGPIWREGFASVKTPSVQVRNLGTIEREEFLRLVKGTTQAVFRAFQPTVLIADTVPQGNIQELTPHLGKPIRKILFLRPSPFLNSWEKYPELVGRYDHLLIPYERDDGVTYPGNLADRGEWVGRIMLRTHDAILSRADARNRLGLPKDGRIVLVSFGGGGSDEAEERMAMVFKAVAEHPDTLFAVLRPPLGRYKLPPIESENIRLFSYFPIMECLNAFDAALSTSGTNMAAELAHVGLPMVWMPLQQVSVDQMPNAILYARRGVGLLPRPATSASIAAAIRTVLDQRKADAMRQRMAALRRPNGADVAAERIAAWCASPAAAASAAKPGGAAVAPSA